MKIVAAGMGRGQIRDAAVQAGGDKVEVLVMSDMEGAKLVKSRGADYYIGSCTSGQGGALSIAIAVLGYNNCLMLSTMGPAPKPEEVRRKVLSGNHRAYGINFTHAQAVVPVLIQTLLEKQKES